jgi:hypothetical protein
MNIDGDRFRYRQYDSTKLSGNINFVLLLLSIRDFRPVGVLKIVQNMKNKVRVCIKMKRSNCWQQIDFNTMSAA